VNTLHTQKRVGVLLKSENIQFNDKQMPNDEDFYIFLDFCGFLKLTSSHYFYESFLTQNLAYRGFSGFEAHQFDLSQHFRVTRIFGFLKLINSHYFRKWFHSELCHK
jgi:hypothetical protein